MSDTKKTGGPAYPTAYNCYDGVGGFTTEYVNGMTLRDHFAGLAMAGDLGSGGFIRDQYEAAKWYYAMADAMLKAREQ
jgi:hypothetical protein